MGTEDAIKKVGVVRASEANSRGKHPGGRPPRQDYVDNRERDQDILTEYVVHRLTYAEIGVKYGISTGRVGAIVKRMRETGAIDHNELRANSRAFLEEIRRRQMEISTLMPAPVTAGKDGDVVIDPETGQVVRDYAAPLKAMSDAVRTDDSIAKRFGLDAATKTEVAAVVKYEVVGLATDDLT